MAEPWRLVAVLGLWAPVTAAFGQTDRPPIRPQIMLRLGGGAITANGTGEIQPAVHLAAGLLLAGRLGFVAQYVQHATPQYPTTVDLNAFTRRFLLGGVEWSPHPMDLRDPGDLHGSVRLGGGAVFREALDPGGALALGLDVRVALHRHLAAMLDIQGLLTLLPDDAIERCPVNLYDPFCHPLASAGSSRSEGLVSILLEARW